MNHFIPSDSENRGTQNLFRFCIDADFDETLRLPFFVGSAHFTHRIFHSAARLQHFLDRTGEQATRGRRGPACSATSAVSRPRRAHSSSGGPTATPVSSEQRQAPAGRRRARHRRLNAPRITLPVTHGITPSKTRPSASSRAVTWRRVLPGGGELGKSDRRELLAACEHRQQKLA